MNILNENVRHIMFGFGVITKVDDHRICVQFKDNIETKMFLYPEVFEKFMKAVEPTVQNYILEELHRKQEQLKLEIKRKEKESEAAKLEEENATLALLKKKSTSRITKKKLLK